MRALAFATAMVLSACSYGPTPPVVTIAPGLHPMLTAAQAERFARDAIAATDIVQPGGFRPLSVVSITAIPGGPTVGGYLAGMSWIIDVRGAFVERTGFHGRETARPVGGIRVLISDADGSVISADFTD
jgi:hypothetical protein